MCGGPSPAKDADDEGRQIIDVVKASILEKSGAQGEGKTSGTFVDF